MWLPWFQNKEGKPAHFLIAGPCALENNDLHLEIADALCQVSEECGLPVVFKGSFDKANRCQGDSPRGPGMDEGLRMLDFVQSTCGLPVLTDVHEVTQVTAVADVCEVIQVPAALCRQTDLLRAVAKTGRSINLKKGQWVGVSEMAGAVDKVRLEDWLVKVAITERGSFFGYGDLVVDMRNIHRLKELCRVPVILDATHAVQSPGRAGPGGSSGVRVDIEPLARAGAAAGATGLFLEVHPRPEEAPSDGACMLQLRRLLPLMRDVTAIWSCLNA